MLNKVAGWNIMGWILFVSSVLIVGCGDSGETGAKQEESNTGQTEEEDATQLEVPDLTTPEALYQEFLGAWEKKDWKRVYRLYHPGDRPVLLGDLFKQFHRYALFAAIRGESDFNNKLRTIRETHGLEERADAVFEKVEAKKLENPAGLEKRSKLYTELFENVDQPLLFSELASAFYTREIGDRGVVVYDLVLKELKQVDPDDTEAIKKRTWKQDEKWFVSYRGMQQITEQPGEPGETDSSDSTPTNLSPIKNWTYDGKTLQAKTILVRRDEFFDQKGVKLILINSDIDCGDTGVLVGRGDYMTIFFPKKQEGYGKPTALNIRIGNQNTSMNSRTGYPGAIKVKEGQEGVMTGWVNISSDVLGKENSSLQGTFKTSLCPQ